MSTRNRILSAVIFAALWVAFMLWWSYPDKGVAHVAILSAIGVLLGLVWYWLTGRQRPGT
jgi:hypothetical protein